jgi:hypothetical protein
MSDLILTDFDGDKLSVKGGIKGDDLLMAMRRSDGHSLFLLSKEHAIELIAYVQKEFDL